MTDLPKQIDRKIRKVIANLQCDWELIKKRDHYFIRIGDNPMICVANNASKQDKWETDRTLQRIRKAVQ